MQKKINTNIEHLIAKIDNDFNPDNSDWIPRVGAWAIDAMSQLDVLRTKRMKKKVSVKDRIAYSPCDISNQNVQVYDENGCEILEANGENCVCSNTSTGERTSVASACNTTGTTDLVVQDAAYAPDVQVVTRQSKDYPSRYNVVPVGTNSINTINCNRNFVIIDNNKIELNYDAKYIYVETEYIETYVSDVYNCELPVIPNNGLLLEAIAYYCVYKMLCRGYKHPVFNLNASQYGTNPWFTWTQLKEEARRSVINGNIDDDNSSKLFRSNMIIEMFDNRNQ